MLKVTYKGKTFDISEPVYDKIIVDFHIEVVAGVITAEDAAGIVLCEEGLVEPSELDWKALNIFLFRKGYSPPDLRSKESDKAS